MAAAAEDQATYTCNCLKAHDTTGVMEKSTTERRECGPKDVRVDIQYSGICHSDLHQLRAEWPMNIYYPMVAGHEGAGVVTDVGSEVTKVKVGDHVGVGCFVDSCRDCPACDRALEQYCENGNVWTYNSVEYEKNSHIECNKCSSGRELTFGTYCDGMTVDELFVFKVDERIPLEVAGPLLCAGITMWDPLTVYGAKDKGAEMSVGILGFGGLGHMGLKFAKSFGNNTWALSSSERKKSWADDLGVNYCNYNDAEQVAQCPKFDLIIDTVSASHDINPFMMGMLGLDGRVVIVGIPNEPFAVHAFSLIMGRKTVSGSLVGGTAATQEMLDYCGEVGEAVWPIATVIHPSEVNEAMENLIMGKNPKARYVIDCTKLKEDFETVKVEHGPHIVSPAANVETVQI